MRTYFKSFDAVDIHTIAHALNSWCSTPKINGRIEIVDKKLTSCANADGVLVSLLVEYKVK